MGASFEVGLRRPDVIGHRVTQSALVRLRYHLEETGTRSFSRDNTVCREQSPSNRIHGEKVTPRV